MTIRKLDVAADMERVKNLYKFETESGKNLIAGVDEAGRGCLFGSMMVGAVILPKNLYIERLDDSKKLSPKIRAELYDKIIAQALCYSVEEVSIEEIDAVNIYQATINGMIRAVQKLPIQPEIVLVDAMKIEIAGIETRSIIRGDKLSASIAAASILAKVTRDRMADIWAEKYPVYGLEHNRGYGTKAHMAAIEKFGYTEMHRRSFNPVKSMIERGF